ncbi:MAG: CC_3452 family protein [Novosphingobium sp.]
MTTIARRPLSRTVLAAGLALVGTIGGLLGTAAPARAGGIYHATLSAPLGEARQEVLGSALWRCEGTSCRTGSDDSSPVNSCARVVRKFGPVASFATARGEFSAEQLQRCNANAPSGA